MAEPTGAARAALPRDGPLSAPDGVEVVHIDADLVVCDKPAGLLSVEGRGQAGRDCLAARVQARWPDALVVHRLDMATSGLIVFARGPVAQRTLNRAFAERRVSKRYLAVVAGRVEPDTGKIDLPLGADWPNRPRQQVDHATGRPALTHYRTLAFDAAARTTRLELEPVTGRSHQLRVHLAALGHPILGDALYAPAEVVARATRLSLHATELGFEHPRHGDPVRFASAVPF